MPDEYAYEYLLYYIYRCLIGQFDDNDEQMGTEKNKKSIVLVLCRIELEFCSSEQLFQWGYEGNS